jgi:prevent-host-death family protein
MTTTLSSREFNQKTSEAKKAASNGPVFITDRGQPSHVLLTIEDYRKLTGEKKKNIVELLGVPAEEYFDFEPPRISIKLRVPDLS